MEEKRNLYFAKGAKEYWLCDEAGCMSFFSPREKMQKSALFPDMQNQIAVDA